ELTGVVVGLGPGSYTGLRVGVMSAKTLAYAVGCELVGVETFRAIARRVPVGAATLDVIAEAQQRRRYPQRFTRSDSGWESSDPIAIRDLGEWLGSVPEGAAVSGPGVDLYEGEFPETVRPVAAEFRHPDAESVYREGLVSRERGGASDLWAV